MFFWNRTIFPLFVTFSPLFRLDFRFRFMRHNPHGGNSIQSPGGRFRIREPLFHDLFVVYKSRNDLSLRRSSLLLLLTTQIVSSLFSSILFLFLLLRLRILFFRGILAFLGAPSSFVHSFSRLLLRNFRLPIPHSQLHVELYSTAITVILYFILDRFWTQKNLSTIPRVLYVSHVLVDPQSTTVANYFHATSVLRHGNVASVAGDLEDLFVGT